MVVVGFLNICVDDIIYWFNIRTTDNKFLEISNPIKTHPKKCVIEPFSLRNISYSYITNKRFMEQFDEICTNIEKQFKIETIYSIPSNEVIDIDFMYGI